jgi:hypothetical protein
MGHVERMGADRLPYRVLHGEVVGGARAKGKPETQYRHCIKGDLELFNIPIAGWMILARIRADWRAAVNLGLRTFITFWTQNRGAKRQKVKQAKAERMRIRQIEEATLPRRTRPRRQHSSIEQHFEDLEEYMHQNPAFVTIGRGKKERARARQPQKERPPQPSRTHRILAGYRGAAAARVRNHVTMRNLSFLDLGIEYDDHWHLFLHNRPELNRLEAQYRIQHQLQPPPPQRPTPTT